MYPRDLVFPILLISIRFSTSSVIRPQNLLIVQLSTEPAKNLEDVPDRWKTLDPEYKAPQIEIQVMKNHILPDKSWVFINEYKYSSKDYHGAAEMTSLKDKKKILQIENDGIEAEKKKTDNDVHNNIDFDNQPIDFRNIFTAPTLCPEGEKEDSKGRCRTFIN